MLQILVFFYLVRNLLENLYYTVLAAQESTQNLNPAECHVNVMSHY